jgi:hypothetical protein
MWLLSLAGVPLLVLGVDVLRSRRLIGFFQNLIWPNGSPEVLETRDYIWAVALIVFGIVIAGYGIAELINPRPVLRADTDGLLLRLGHPLASASSVPWVDVVDIGSEDLDDEGDVVPVFWLKVADATRLPSRPWGARWLEPNTLAVLASDWERAPAAVVIELTRTAMSVARLRQSEAASSVGT